MKEWIQHIDGQDIKEAYDNIHLQYKTAKEIDNKILTRLREKTYEFENKKQKPVLRRFLIAAAVLIMLLIPAIFLIDNFRPSGMLRLVQIEQHVVFKENNCVISPVPGDVIKKGYEITTGTESSCIMQYKNKTTITLDQESGITIATFNKSKIILAMDSGEMLLNENINKRTRIEVQTPNALIYAIGTRYSVEYNKARKETIIKTFEGIVFIVTIFNKEFTLKAGEEITIKNNEVADKKEITLYDKNLLKEWHIKPMYFNTRVKDPVIGFDIYKEFIAAVTERSIVCFTHEEILWEYVFDNPCITAAPTLYNRKVYIPTARSILVYSLSPGVREGKIDLIDNMRTGHTIIPYKNKLYITLASGIYVYDIASGIMSDSPAIPVIEPALPVFYKNNIYITSYITNNMEAYDLTGCRLWSLALTTGSSCSPFFIENFIFIATNNGIFYKISLEGNIVNHITLNKRITAIKQGKKQTIFLQTDEQMLFAINYTTLTIEETLYNVNAVIINNKNIITGKTNGTINITGMYTGLKSIITLPGSQPFSFICWENIIFTGLKNGSIMKFEYK